MDADQQRIAALERQVATLQQQLQVENNRRRHLEVKAKILAASFNRVRMEAQDLRAELFGERGVAQRGDAVERRRADRRWRPARWLRGAGNASLAQSDNERLPSRPPMCREWVRFRDKNRNRDQ